MERTSIILRRIGDLAGFLAENPGGFTEEQKQKLQSARAILIDVYTERCTEAVDRSRQ